MILFNSNRHAGWMASTKRRYLIFAISCLTAALLFYPFESAVIPTWKLQVVDVNENACRDMSVTQSWGHYSLYLDGGGGSDDRFTDINGYVEFPERTIRASLLRRTIVPVIAHILAIAHGGGGADGAVWASGIKDVAWLSYKVGKPLPGKMRVERCISGGT
jgi:hypothetical protein